MKVQVFLAEADEGSNKVFFGNWVKDPSLYDLDRLRLAIEYDAPEENVFVAAETAFAIFNSYPEELHCAPEYLPLVKQYRKAKNRSLSVGDVVRIDEKLLLVAAFGFEELEGSLSDLPAPGKPGMLVCHAEPFKVVDVVL